MRYVFWIIILGTGICLNTWAVSPREGESPEVLPPAKADGGELNPPALNPPVEEVVPENKPAFWEAMPSLLEDIKESDGELIRFYVERSSDGSYWFSAEFKDKVKFDLNGDGIWDEEYKIDNKEAK